MEFRDAADKLNDSKPYNKTGVQNDLLRDKITVGLLPDLILPSMSLAAR